MSKRYVAAVGFLIGALVVAAAATAGGSHRASPTKLTVWVGWSAGHELTTFKKVAAQYDAQHSDVTVNVVGGIDDNKIVAAIRSGTAPDVVSSFNSYNVGSYCGSGGWIDLAPYLKKDHIDASMFPPAPRYYTQYAGKRCALPLLADDYGLYYNKSMFKAAGIAHPPKTISELTADAKKLTVRNKDGSIKVAGIDPIIGFYENVPERWITSFGGKWNDCPGPRDSRQGSRLGEVGQVAEEPRRLVRLQEPRPVPGRPGRRVLRLTGLREGQARDEPRR